MLINDAETTVIVMDQFHGPTPYALAQQPMLWRDFLADVDRGAFDGGWQPPVKTTVRELDRLGMPMATTAYRCGANGHVEVWRARWDSSG